MNKKYHFISGLPRSGSTLLTSVLNQNPRFYSGITDSLITYMSAVINANVDRPIRASLTEEVLKNTIEGLFNGYYKNIDKEIIFNTNRGWTKKVEYLHRINSNFKIICCVRELRWIFNSFELLFKTRKTLRDPTNPNNLYGSVEGSRSVWTRTDQLATEQNVVRSGYDALLEAYYGPYRNHLLLVEYDNLTNYPKKSIQKIYDFIEEPYYNHDFNNVEYFNDEFDFETMITGLHTVRKKIEPNPGTRVLPPDLWDKYSNWEFWRHD